MERNERSPSPKCAVAAIHKETIAKEPLNIGQRGPAPKPTALKQLHGTYRSDRAPHKEATPQPATGNQLKAPEWLSEEAKAKWDELALRLHNLGLITEIDLDVFAAFCVSWANWRDAEECIEKHGATTKAQSGYEAVSPHVTRAKNHLAEVIKLSSLLGLSPSARSRIEVRPDEKSHDELLA
jgi:P27 family predicted phage terminase small subunit